VAVPFPDQLTLELTQSGVIEGFVIAPDGKAAAGATVQLVGDGDTTSVETGEGGGFSGEVAEGVYRVQAQRGLEAGILSKPVSVAAGATVSGLIIPLGAGASIAGTIVSDGEGAPIAGASIAVSPYQRNGDSGRGVSPIALCTLAARAQRTRASRIVCCRWQCCLPEMRDGRARLRRHPRA
jgi:hypothetical protein